MDTQSILCFQHCNLQKIFCFKLPEICPLCGSNLYSLSTELLVPPFRLPFPFKDASKLSCCVVIKPTNADFLYSYNNSCNLHVGVVNSKGNVYEYKKEGIVNTESQSWNQCLEVVVSKRRDDVKSFWDSTLNNLCRQSTWSSSLYNEDNHNCYQFVLTFLRTLNLPHLEKFFK